MPGLTSELIHQRLTQKFAEAVGPLSAASGDRFCTFAPSRLLEICRFLKAEPDLSFDLLQDLTATDHPKDKLIRVVYHFYSYTHRHLLVAKVELDRDRPVVDSLECVWKAANWLEREVFDLFGVSFVGHSDLRRILLPDDWVGWPLRKDYQEAGGYQGISNLRDNPLDQYLSLDRRLAAQREPPRPAETQPPEPKSATPQDPAVAKTGS